MTASLDAVEIGVWVRAARGEQGIGVHELVWAEATRSASTRPTT